MDNAEKKALGPKGKFFTGHTKMFQADPLGFMSDLAAEYGEVAKFRFGPSQKVYFISNPEMIKEVLVTKQNHFVKSDDFKSMKPIVGEGLLTSEKEFHLRQRRMIQPSFKKTDIMKYGQDMIDIAKSYTSAWKGGEERIITHDMMDLTLAIVSKTMFSKEFEDGYQIIGDSIETSMRMAIKRMRNLFSLPLWIPTKNNRKFKKAVKQLDNVLYSLIGERREGMGSEKDMLEILLAARSEDGIGMTDTQVRDELMTIFLAGHETTANALSWTLYLLSQNPEAEGKLYREIDELLGDKSPRPEDFMKLTYTQNVVWESLRMYPPGFFTGRKVEKDIEINGYKFKKNDMVLTSQYIMHRKSEFFPEPEKFIPERFENNYLRTIPSFAYFPFGGGPRVCIGNHFALMEAVLVLAAILQKYKLVLSPGQIVKPFPSITLRPKGGLRMVVEERKQIAGDIE
ncbi:cytochrome P450 [Peribacillus sp. B-H-3]|uniref:cytochrome P450 n=1 Tax=Peribacillus sp. B-H-3 TaxID=3400420 RepID=UPI003B014E59